MDVHGQETLVDHPFPVGVVGDDSDVEPFTDGEDERIAEGERRLDSLGVGGSGVRLGEFDEFSGSNEVVVDGVFDRDAQR